jgi:hypothetical protein
MLEQEYKDYAELTRQIKELEDKQLFLKNIIMNDLEANKLFKLQTDFGTFSRVVAAKYRFSDNVKSLEDSVKELKEKEKHEGIAKYEETISLRFQLK